MYIDASFVRYLHLLGTDFVYHVRIAKELEVATFANRECFWNRCWRNNKPHKIKSMRIYTAYWRIPIKEKWISILKHFSHFLLVTKLDFSCSTVHSRLYYTTAQNPSMVTCFLRLVVSDSGKQWCWSWKWTKSPQPMFNWYKIRWIVQVIVGCINIKLCDELIYIVCMKICALAFLLCTAQL